MDGPTFSAQLSSNALKRGETVVSTARCARLSATWLRTTWTEEWCAGLEQPSGKTASSEFGDDHAALSAKSTAAPNPTRPPPPHSQLTPQH